EIAAGRAHGTESYIASCRCVAVAEAGWPGAEIGFTNATDRSPEIVIILTFPNRHAGIGHGGVGEGEKSRKIDSAEMHLIGDVDDDLIVEARRRAQARRSIVSPENSNKTLFGRACGRCENAVAANRFRFGVGGGILGAVHIRRRRNAKLTGRLDDEGFAITPMRAESERDQADRILAPVSGLIAGEIIYADVWLR